MFKRFNSKYSKGLFNYKINPIKEFKPLSPKLLFDKLTFKTLRKFN